MVMFNNCQLKRYNTPNDIIDDFFPIRKQLYTDRREYLIKEVKAELKILTQKHRFIQGILKRDIVFADMNKQQMADYLKTKNFTPSEEGDFDFLLQMPLWSLCSDKLADLQTKLEQKNQALARLEKTTANEMWIEELDRLAEAYILDLKTNFPYQDI